MRSALGSVYDLGGGRWKVQVEAGRDPVTGKRRRRTLTVRGTRKDAERAKAAMLLEGGRSDGADMTLQEFFDGLYWPSTTDLRETTRASYRRRWETFVKTPLGGHQMARIAPLTVQRWVGAIEGDARRVEAFKTLRQVMAKAVRWGLLDSSPCDRVEPPHKPRHEPQVLDSAQASAYLRLFRDTPLEAVVLVALGGALRRSEIAALSWGDVSPSGVVTVDKALTSVEGRPVPGPPKTPNSTRRVHLPPSVAGRLDELRMPDRFPIAMDSSGGRMNPDNISKAYRRVLRDAPPGLPRVPLRDLRHTSLTLTLEAGADVLAVSRRAGHSNVGVTSAYYLRPHDSVDEAAAEGLDGLL